MGGWVASCRTMVCLIYNILVGIIGILAHCWPFILFSIFWVFGIFVYEKRQNFSRTDADRLKLGNYLLRCYFWRMTFFWAVRPHLTSIGKVLCQHILLIYAIFEISSIYYKDTTAALSKNVILYSFIPWISM